MLLDGPMNAEVFRAYVEQVLRPCLKPGDIVVRDNLPAHKVDGVRQTLEQAGASCFICHPTRPIPAFASTSLNLIEMAFAKLKALLRGAAKRTRDDRRHYNEVGPHSSRGYLTPAAFAARLREQEAVARQATGRTAKVCGASAQHPVASPSRKGQTKAETGVVVSSSAWSEKTGAGQSDTLWL